MVSSYEDFAYDSPEIGETSKTYVGDRIFFSTIGSNKICITPQKELIKKQNFGLHVLIYKKEISMCKLSQEDKFFTAPYYNYFFQNDSSTNPVSYSKQKDSTYKLCQKVTGVKWGCIKGLTNEDIILNESLSVLDYSFLKQITYLGRSQGVHKFLYEAARFDIKQYFEVDTTDSEVIIFKGAILDIIESDSSSITIKVIRGFH